MELTIRGEDIYKGSERVGSIWGCEEHGWKASLLIDLLDAESGLGRYMGCQHAFSTRGMAEEWVRENEHMVHAFTRRGGMPTIVDMLRYDADQKCESE